MEEKKKIPHTCPVCNGNGKVANGFYNQTSGQWLTTDATPEMCQSCLGTGIVWGEVTMHGLQEIDRANEFDAGDNGERIGPLEKNGYSFETGM